MRIYKAADYNDMSRKAANIIAAQVIMKPDCVLGLATGSTPVGTYRNLVEISSLKIPIFRTAQNQMQRKNVRDMKI